MLIADRYETLELLGAGGMGEVFLAEDRVTGDQVALKILKEEVSQDIVVRFDRECELLASMSHPAVVRVRDRGTSEDRVFYAMDYVPWPTLSQLMTRRMKEGKAFSVDEVVTILRAVAAALDHLHSLDVVHRDLKPSNLMVSDDLQVRLIDFGLAGMLFDRMTRTGALLGSMLYLSPEQIRADKSLDKRSDVYQMGLILYEMMTGKKAYTDIVAYVGRIRSGAQPVESPHDLNAQVPRAISDVIMCALSVNPDDRPSTAGEFHAMMASAALDPSGPVPAARPSRRVRSAQRQVEAEPPTSKRSTGSKKTALRKKRSSRSAQPVPVSPPAVQQTSRRSPAALGVALVLVASVFALLLRPAPPPPILDVEVIQGFFRTEMRWRTEEIAACSVQLLREGEPPREISASGETAHQVTFVDLEPSALYRVQVLASGRPTGHPVQLEAPPEPSIGKVTASHVPEGLLLTFSTPVFATAEASWEVGNERGQIGGTGAPADRHRLLLPGFRPRESFKLTLRCTSRLGEVWTAPARLVEEF